MKITLELTPDQFDLLGELMLEKGMELEDDGNEGDPHAALLYKAQKQIAAALKGGKR